MPEFPATPADPNLSPSADPLPGDQVTFDQTEHEGTGGANVPKDPAGTQGPGDADPDAPHRPVAGPKDDGEGGPATLDMSGTAFSQVAPGTLPDDADHNEAGAGPAADPNPSDAAATTTDPETPKNSSGSNTPSWGGEGGHSTV